MPDTPGQSPGQCGLTCPQALFGDLACVRCTKKRQSEDKKYMRFKRVGSGRKPQNAALGFQSEKMNKLEESFAAHLETLRQSGEIISWQFEAMRLLLAPKTSYCPDFFVMDKDGALTFYEVKGFWQDDARVKIKVAAEKFPQFYFTAVQKKKGQWVYESF